MEQIWIVKYWSFGIIIVRRIKSSFWALASNISSAGVDPQYVISVEAWSEPQEG